MRYIMFLLVLEAGNLFAHSPGYHDGPINIQDCNYYELIFVGKIVAYEPGEFWGYLTVEVEEEFKFGLDSCALRILTKNLWWEWEKYPEERYLIFADRFAGEYECSFGMSTGLAAAQSYPEDLIQRDLAYLRYYAMHPSRMIKELYRPSGSGCVPDDHTYIAEGELVLGQPHGDWIYYTIDGRVTEEGGYGMGTKWGTWQWYHDNGYVAGTSVYWDGVEIKRVLYTNDGELYCFNDSCSLWAPDPYQDRIISSLSKEEMRATKNRSLPCTRVDQFRDCIPKEWEFWTPWYKICPEMYPSWKEAYWYGETYHVFQKSDEPSVGKSLVAIVEILELKSEAVEHLWQQIELEGVSHQVFQLDSILSLLPGIHTSYPDDYVPAQWTMLQSDLMIRISQGRKPFRSEYQELVACCKALFASEDARFKEILQDGNIRWECP